MFCEAHLGGNIELELTKIVLFCFYVALALVLVNLWSYVKWHRLVVPRRGPLAAVALERDQRALEFFLSNYCS